MSSNEEIIRNVFYSPETGFGGIEKIYRTLKKQGHKISRTEIKQFIRETRS